MCLFLQRWLGPAPRRDHPHRIPEYHAVGFAAMEKDPQSVEIRERLGPAMEKAVPAVEAALKDKEASVREAAFNALYVSGRWPKT
jgi:hypothetical protein